MLLAPTRFSTAQTLVRKVRHLQQGILASNHSVVKGGARPSILSIQSMQSCVSYVWLNRDLIKLYSLKPVFGLIFVQDLCVWRNWGTLCSQVSVCSQYLGFVDLCFCRILCWIRPNPLWNSLFCRTNYWNPKSKPFHSKELCLCWNPDFRKIQLSQILRFRRTLSGAWCSFAVKLKRFSIQTHR